MTKIAVSALLVMLLFVNLIAAPRKRVKFPPGRSTVVLKGRTTGGRSESGGMDPAEAIALTLFSYPKSVH